jgi:prepilin-type N-terminal cleavage/methylation domain-containing protein
MSNPSPPNDAGFTLTELIAGLLVASLLLAGIVDIVRRYARTTEDVREAAYDIRAARLLDAMMDELARLDPGSLRLSPQAISGTVGGTSVTGKLIREADATRLEWSSPAIERTLSLPAGTTYVQHPSGAILVTAPREPVPLAIALPRRTLPFDCQFDTVSRECRQ